MGRCNTKREDTDEVEVDLEDIDPNLHLDASHHHRRRQSIPTLPIFGDSQITCTDAGEEKNNEFSIPGKVIINNSNTINGCVLQMRILIADKKDSHGKPFFFDVQIECPHFEPTTAFVNGKPTKMTIQ